MPKPNTDYSQDNAFFRKIRTLQEQIDQLKRQYANKAKWISQSAEPTLSIEGSWVLWHDTDDGKIYLVARLNSTTKKVELI